MEIFQIVQPGRVTADEALERFPNVIIAAMTEASIALDLYTKSQQAKAAFDGIRFHGDDREAEVPRFVLFEAPFLHARSFLFAFDNLLKAMEVLSKMLGVSPEVATIVADFEQAFPTLRETRDSAHHAEDRVQGKARKKIIAVAPGTPLPFDLPKTPGPYSYSARFVDPRTGFTIEELKNDVYGNTLASGEYGSLPITRASMVTCQVLIQRLFDTIELTSPTRHWKLHPYSTNIMGEENVANYARSIGRTI